MTIKSSSIKALSILASLGVACSLLQAQNVIVQINSSDNVNFLVTDPKGRRTGVDPRGARSNDTWKWFEEIPHSNYAFTSVGSLDTNDTPEGSMEFLHRFPSPQDNGTFTIRVFGNSLGAFDLSLSVQGSGKAGIPNAGFEIRSTPIEKDSAVTFFFNHHGGPGTPVTFVKLVSATSLIQDVYAMHRLRWIKDQRTADKYLNLIRAFSSQTDQVSIDDIRHSLATILQHVAADSTTTLTTDACGLLRADTEYLYQQLTKAR